MKQKSSSATSAIINDKIPYNKVQVITNDAQNLGVLDKSEALRLARQSDLDLVLISESGNEGVPIVKIMDFGKVIYAKKKQQAEAKKNQKIIQVKEVKLRPKIGEHDYQTKINQVIDFLKDEKHVKITLMFKGREAVAKEERGTELFNKINTSFQEAGLTKLVQEKDSKGPQLWSRIYYLKK